MSKSKAQISLFIILALILTLVFGIGIYFVSDLNKEETKKSIENAQQANLETAPVKFYIDACLKESSIISAHKLGLKGGYFILPKEYLDTGYVELPYYYFNGKKSAPSKEMLEEAL